MTTRFNNENVPLFNQRDENEKAKPLRFNYFDTFPGNIF